MQLIWKNTDNSKYIYSGYKIAFDGRGSRRFGNDFVRNVLISGVNNSSLFDTDNHKNNLLVLGEGPTDVTVLVLQQKSLVFILVKQIQNFNWVWITIMIPSICLLMEKKSIHLLLIIKMSTFQLNFA